MTITPPYTPNAFIQTLAAGLPEPRFGEERIDYIRRCNEGIDETQSRAFSEAALLRWHSDEALRLIHKLETAKDDSPATITVLRDACLYLLRQQVKA